MRSLMHSDNSDDTNSDDKKKYNHSQHYPRFATAEHALVLAKVAALEKRLTSEDYESSDDEEEEKVVVDNPYRPGYIRTHAKYHAVVPIFDPHGYESSQAEGEIADTSVMVEQILSDDEKKELNKRFVALMKMDDEAQSTRRNLMMISRLLQRPTSLIINYYWQWENKRVSDAKYRKYPDTCSVCDTAGKNLLCCTYCPTVYHLHCVHLEAVPESYIWKCPTCVAKINTISTELVETPTAVAAAPAISLEDIAVVAAAVTPLAVVPAPATPLAVEASMAASRKSVPMEAVPIAAAMGASLTAAAMAASVKPVPMEAVPIAAAMRASSTAMPVPTATAALGASSLPMQNIPLIAFRQHHEQAERYEAEQYTALQAAALQQAVAQQNAVFAEQRTNQQFVAFHAAAQQKASVQAASQMHQIQQYATAQVANHHYGMYNPMTAQQYEQEQYAIERASAEQAVLDNSPNIAFDDLLPIEGSDDDVLFLHTLIRPRTAVAQSTVDLTMEMIDLSKDDTNNT